MYIIILGPAYPYRGGISAFNERLASEYQKQGHKVELYTFTLQYPGFLFPGKTQYSTEPAPVDKVVYRKVNSCSPFNWIKVGKEIRRKRPDLLITAYWLPFMGPCLGTIARIASQNGHTRSVGLLHNMIPHEHRPGDRLFSRYFVSCNQGFVSLSKAVLEDLTVFDKVKPRVFCPHPLYDHYGGCIDKFVARKKLSLDTSGRYILFFGFIREYKGLDLLLEAIADRRLCDLNVKLIVAGEFYGDPKPYYDTIDRLGIRERVVLYTDFIPDSEVGLYFGASDLVAQPYKSATQSGVTQVAFHYEKPMLVTNVGGLPEIVPDGKVGYVVEPVPSAIADALVNFYSEEKELCFVEGLKIEKQKYSWSKMVDAIGGLFS